MSRELMPKSGIMMPHVVINRDAAVVGVSTVDGVAGAVDLTGKYLQKTDAADVYQTKTEGASKDYVLNSIQPIMEGALFKADPFVDNNIPFRSAGANGVESVDMMKVTTDNAIKIGSYASSVQGVEIHSAGRLQVVDQNDSGVETKYPVYSKRYRPEIEDLPFAAIGSYVKDSKGRTIGVNRTGINSDIKQFTQKVTFQQPVTIADGVGDYDAVTMRQLRNSGGGSGGATMNGIMNYGIGTPHMAASRALIHPYDVTLDGQLLERAKYPELWVFAQMLTPIDDSDWLADPSQRGKYSLGDGTTTFRVPDWNGVQDGSIEGLFFRGGKTSASDMTVALNSAPNITASLDNTYAGTRGIHFSPSGAFAGGTVTPATNLTALAASGDAYGRITFDASRSSAVYGRNNSAEIVPNKVSGVWVVRANGAFIAANTSWSVINGDSAAPGTGTAIKGGEVRSDYNIGDSMYIRSSMRADGNYGKRGGGVWRIEDFKGKSNEIQFNMDTNVIFPVPIVTDGKNVVARSIQSPDGTWPTVSPWVGCQLTGRVPNSGFDGAQFNMYIQENVGVDTYGGLLFIGANTTQAWLFNQFGNAIAPANWVSNSDIRIKKDIAKIEEPLEKMKKLHGYTWRRIDGDQFGIGFIAQEVQAVYPELVYTGPDRTLPDGTVVKGVLSPDSTGIAVGLHHEAILALMEQIDTLKAEIAELKSNK